ncbi:MAG TPA: peptidoglycan DD-metalloendopeptidase family protein [Gemmataceae bacterium]|nr:peptidoglycan DD-metalloendopeptidase family protein [Gemmataceae bacterium]
MHPAVALVVVAVLAASDGKEEPRKPLLRTADLRIGETQDVQLSDGAKATVKLLAVEETRDKVRSAIREAMVRVEVNGKTETLVSGYYRLPVTVGGVQVDCPATKGLYQNHDPWEDSWGLDKDARLRLWPAGSPWMPPREFVYPIKQRWFASATQMANEPSFVDGGDAPTGRKIYYHNGLDIGGCEGMAEVVAATDGKVVSAGKAVLPGYGDPPVAARYDVVYVRDARDWYYRYSHLKTIEVKPGDTVKMGQKIGLLGKEGASGGWSHLHFDIKSRQPSGKWGTEEGYAFLWEAYQRQYKPQLVAVARPHHLIWAGDRATLDGSRSWSAAGKIDRYEWTFTDGTYATGPRVERSYDTPGEYCEILKIVDAKGRVDYDFAVVLVIDKATEGKFSPTIHASYAPTFAIHPGDPVTFKVRTFYTDPAGETWDFGDGSPTVKVRSDGNAKPHAPDGYAETVHRYAKPGHYLPRVEQLGKNGTKLTARLHVVVEEK